MTTPSQKYFNLENTKTMRKMLLSLLELAILIINFLSTNFKLHKNAANRELKKAFNDKKILLAAQELRKLRNILERAKFTTETILT